MKKGVGLTSRAGKRLITRGQFEEQEERKNLLDEEDAESREGIADLARNNNNRPWKAKAEDFEILIPMVGRPPSKPPSDQCVEAEIQPEETLASISLKYNVPIAELKRVNWLINDNDFFAHKTIKIPIKPASLLTEILPACDQMLPSFENGDKMDDFSFNLMDPPADALLQYSTAGEVEKAKILLTQIDNNVMSISKKQENRDPGFSTNEAVAVHLHSPLLKEESSVFDLLNTNKKWIGFYLLVLVLAGFCVYLIENYERQILTHNSSGS